MYRFNFKALQPFPTILVTSLDLRVHQEYKEFVALPLALVILGMDFFYNLILHF